MEQEVPLLLLLQLLELIRVDCRAHSARIRLLMISVARKLAALHLLPNFCWCSCQKWTCRFAELPPACLSIVVPVTGAHSLYVCVHLVATS